MKLAVTFSVLFLAMLGTLVMAQKDSGAARKDLEGTWLPESAELAGAKYPDQILKTMKLVLKDENYKVHVGDQTDEGMWKLDPDKSPRATDIMGTNGPNKGKVFLAIYEREKDSLRVCYDLSGKARPTEFTTKANTKLFLVSYKRAKP